ncbi:MAG: hypothetical protein J5844_02045, partial [Clostridia bacterium]|nr:hypothetical protein [Clostridia bacterium]
MNKIKRYFLLYLPALLFLLVSAALTYYLINNVGYTQTETEPSYVFRDTQDVPVLLYHHVDKVGKGDSTISLKHFKR